MSANHQRIELQRRGRALLERALVPGDSLRERGSFARWLRGVPPAARALALSLGACAALVALLEYLREDDAQEITALVAVAEHLEARMEATRDPGRLRGLEAEYQETLAKIRELRDDLELREPPPDEPDAMPGAGALTFASNASASVSPRRVLDERMSAESYQAERSPHARAAPPPPSRTLPAQRAHARVAADFVPTRGGTALPPGAEPPPVRPARPSTPVRRATHPPGEPAVEKETWVHAGRLRLTLETPPFVDEDEPATAHRRRELADALRRVLP